MHFKKNLVLSIHQKRLVIPGFLVLSPDRCNGICHGRNCQNLLPLILKGNFRRASSHGLLTYYPVPLEKQCMGPTSISDVPIKGSGLRISRDGVEAAMTQITAAVLQDFI